MIEAELLVVGCTGKTLQDESQTLTGLGMKQDSKLILLGRKARRGTTGTDV